MKKVIRIILFCWAFQGFSQSEKDPSYTREFGYGINFNTIGGVLGGLKARAAFLCSEKSYHHLYLEMVRIKHPKETLVYAALSGRSYIYNKRYYLYMLRPMYGRELILFYKDRDQGVHVNAIVAAGPSIGLRAPYLIIYDGKEVHYDPTVHNNGSKIEGVGNYVAALFQAQPIMGASAKIALSFEIGTFKQSITGFEFGFMNDYLLKPIYMIHNSYGQQFFQSLYVALYVGSRN
ncbi:MAG: hypothetical protein NZM38_08990 [Cytophagales bacterium]|nr:hypothetical protein [Cytophagales bacterium]MDW8384895.1 hypothetical protein [Flammeovirgaceae bacterium]